MISKYFSFTIAGAAGKALLALKTQGNIAVFTAILPNKLPTHPQDTYVGHGSLGHWLLRAAGTMVVPGLG